jgi:hypothetical protein
MASPLYSAEQLVGQQVKCPHCGKVLEVTAVLTIPGAPYWVLLLADGEFARYWPHGGSDN